MSTKTTREGWTPTVEQRVQLQEGLDTLHEARTMVQSIQSPQWQVWKQAQERCLNELQQSFEFFLSGKVISSAYVFAGWIHHPAFHLREIRSIIRKYSL